MDQCNIPSTAEVDVEPNNTLELSNFRKRTYPQKWSKWFQPSICKPPQGDGGNKPLLPYIILSPSLACVARLQCSRGSPSER